MIVWALYVQGWRHAFFNFLIRSLRRADQFSMESKSFVWQELEKAKHVDVFIDTQSLLLSFAFVVLSH